MNHPQDPPRLSALRDSDGGGLRAALEAARRDVPRSADVDVVRRGLAPLLAPPASGAGLAATAVAKAKVIAIVVGIAAGGGAVGVWSHHEAAIARSAAQAATAEAPGRADRESAPQAVTIPTADSTAAIPEPAPVPSATPATIDQPTRASAGRPMPSAVPDEPVARETLPKGDTATEVRLLQSAQDALGSDPGRALALTVEHAQRFPSPLLSQEREVIAITALMRLGRTAEAHTRAAAFYAHYPISAHRRRIEALVGDTPSEKSIRTRAGESHYALSMERTQCG